MSAILILQVVTLTKHRGLSKPDDEQLHTLPMYCLEDTDEHGQRRMEGAPGLEVSVGSRFLAYFFDE